jgi:hypothetical protein
MVNALINIDENTNRVLSIIKVRHGLKDKGEAVEWVVGKFVEVQAEPELRPELIEKMGEIERQKSIRVDDFFKHYGLD